MLRYTISFVISLVLTSVKPRCQLVPSLPLGNLELEFSTLLNSKALDTVPANSYSALVLIHLFRDNSSM